MKPAGHIDSTIAGLPLRLGRLSLPRALSGGLATAGFVGAYVLLEWVSFIHEYKGVPITPWNPGLGVVFACMVLGGARYGIVLFVGVVIAEMAVLRQPACVADHPRHRRHHRRRLRRRGPARAQHLRLDAGLNRLRDIVMLLISGAAGAALVALFVCLLLLADDELDLGDVLVAAGPLVIGDIIGIAVITPLTLRLALRPPPLLDHVSLQALAELALFAAVVTTALWLILGAGEPRRLQVLLPAVPARGGRRACGTASTAPASASPSPSSAWSACCTATATTPTPFTEFQTPDAGADRRPA